jgi:hypothetical protein
MPTLQLSGGGGSFRITFAVNVKANVHNEPDWNASAQVVVEAGQLDRLANDAAQLPPLFVAGPQP